MELASGRSVVSSVGRTVSGAAGRLFARPQARRDGYVFCEAPNGREALDLMRREHPNVVVLDLMMPILSGWDVLQERESDPELRQIPVIIVSATRAPEIATAVDKGICAFLPKPFDIAALSALVRSCLPTASN